MRELTEKEMTYVGGGSEEDSEASEVILDDFYGTVGAGIGSGIGMAMGGAIGAGPGGAVGAGMGGYAGGQLGNSLGDYYVENGENMVPEFDYSGGGGGYTHEDYMEDHGLHPGSGF